MAKKQIESLKVEERSELGKGPNRRLRAQGMVPGVYYDQHGANILVKVAMNPLTKLYHKLGGSQVFHLEVERDGKTEQLPSFMWRMKYDPVKSVPSHIDFFGVDLDKALRVSVPVEVTGKAKGLVEGGVLSVFRDTIEVLCKPMDVPESLVVDVTELDINDSLFVEEIEMPAGVELTTEENFAVVGVHAPAAEVEEEDELLEGEEGAEDEEGGEEAASEE